MLTNDEVYEAFCRTRCKYMNPPSIDALDACASCPISRLASPPPWYAYPDYTPPADTLCLLVDVQRSKFQYSIGIYKELKNNKSGFYNPVFLADHAQKYPSGWQPIQPPAYFLQKPKKR